MAADTRTLKVVVVGNGASGAKMLRSLGVEAEGAGKKASSGGSKFTEMGGKVAKAGASMALGLAAAGVAAAGMVYKVGSGYEQSLNTIESLRQKTDQTTAQVGSKLQGMSGQFAKLGLSTGDAANGVVELVKAGQTVDQAMKSVNATMQLATAGQVDVATAAGLTANTLNMFKLSADQAGHVADSLANAANASSSDINDLGLGLSMSGLAAKSAGLSLDQTSASLALLSNNGLQGSDAGTSLKMMLMSMAAPTGKAAKIIKDLGVNVYDSKGKSLDFHKVLSQLLPSLNKLNDKDRASAIKNIFGTDAMRAVNAFASEGVGGFDKVMGSITATGTAAKTAEAKTAGFSGLVNRIKAQGTSAGQALYMKLAPSLTAVGTKLLDLSAKGPGMAKKLFESLKGSASGGGTGSAIMGELKQLGPVIMKFVNAILPVLKDFGSKLMGTIGPGLRSIGQVIATQFLPGLRAIIPVLTPVVKFILQMLGSAVIGVVKGVILVIKGAFQIIGGLFKLIAAIVKGDWGGAWNAAKTIFMGVINVIKGAFLIWWNGGILSIFRKGLTALLSLGKLGWNGLKGLFSAGTKGISNLLLKIVDILTLPFRKGFSAVLDYVTTGWAYIRGSFSGGVGGIRGILARIIEVISWPYRTAFGAAKALVQGGWSGLLRYFSSGVTSVASTVGRIPGVVKNALSGAASWLVNVGKNIIDGLVGGISGSMGAVAGVVQNLVNQIPAPIRKALGIKSPSTVMKTIGGWITAGLTKGIKEGIPALTEVVKNVYSTINHAMATKSITLAQARNLDKWVSNNYKAGVAIINQRQQLNAKLLSAQKKYSADKAKLDKLVGMKSDMASNYYNAARGSANLSNVAGDGSAENPTTISAILYRFQKKLTDLKSFRANLVNLQKRGVYPSLIDELISMGPEQGSAVAAALVKGTSAQLKQLNSLQAQSFNEAVGGGNQIAGNAYNKSISLAAGQVAADQKAVTNINIQIAGNVTSEKNLAAAIAKAVRDQIARDDKRNGKKK